MRLWWRILYRRLRMEACPRLMVGDEEYYLVGYAYFPEYGACPRLIMKYPGVCMTKDEWEHWFNHGKKLA